MNESDDIDQIIADQQALAMLASQFLPKIELPEKWAEIGASMLRAEIGKATLEPHAFKDSGGEESAFEVIACEAVKRAKIVLREVAGFKRVEVLKKLRWEKWHSSMQASTDATFEAARLQFDKHFKVDGSPPLLNAALKVVFGKRGKGLMSFAWTRFLESDQSAVVRGKLFSDSNYAMIDRDCYATIKVWFDSYFQFEEREIRELHAKAAGKVGGKTGQRRKRARGEVNFISKQVARKLDKALEKAHPLDLARKRKTTRKRG